MSGNKTMLVLMLLCSLAIGFSSAKLFARCELAEELLRTYDFPRDRLADWVCLIRHESDYNTAAKGGPNSDGSYDYGLFQINDHYWCGSTGANGCQMDCDLLLDDDISDDVTCAWKVFKEGGFRNWYGWQNYCKGQDLTSYLAGCNVDTPSKAEL